MEIHVMTWWPDDPNSPAEALKDAAEEGSRVTVSLAQRGTTKDEMLTRLGRILNGETIEPVDAFMTHPGRDLLRWTPCGSEGKTSLKLLNGPDAYAHSSTLFDPRVLRGLGCCPSGGDCESPALYAVPLNLHRLNHVIANEERFARCGGGASVTDLDSFVEFASCLGAEGERVISLPIESFPDPPCEVGNGECWLRRDVAAQWPQFLLENLFLLAAGPAAFEAYWRGEYSGTDAARADSLLTEVLGALERLRPYLNNCPSGDCQLPTKFSESLYEVARGQAAFMITPDWHTASAKGVDDQAVITGPFPGTSGTFLFTLDAFALPSLPGTSTEGGLRWTDVLLREELQEHFAASKGATPAIGDTARSLALLPSLEALLPPNFDLQPLQELMNDWMRAEVDAPALVDFMDERFEEAENLGLLPVACANPPCERP